jgi:succinate-semialdehyde dehydrogenase/glutarate-semialdehyde dehydrogenase
MPTFFESVNPYTGETLARFDAHSREEVRQMLERSEKAFSPWKNAPLPYRLDLLNRLAQSIEQQAEHLAMAMVEEMGKTLTEARAEVQKCAATIRFFVEKAPAWLEARTVPTDARLSKLVYQATGAVLLVMPWNFPLWQSIRAAVPSLCLGNVVLLKHAPNVFRYAGLTEQLFREAGFPEGVFQSLRVDVDQLDPICAHPIVSGVSLTGSERAGRAMAAVAGKHLKKCVLELGGSDPFIVLADADLETAADMAAKARLINNGQSCIAAKRFLVHKSVETEFLQAFARKLSAYIPGDPRLPETLLGPQARPDLAQALHRQLEASRAEGAELYYQVPGSHPNPNFFMPALLRNVQPGMTCFTEEVFGPIAAVTTFETEEEAIRLANDTRYGLGATLHTRNEEMAARMALQLDCGTVAINAMVRSKASLPFGGTKASGYGRELSEHGLYEFANLKAISWG